MKSTSDFDLALLPAPFQRLLAGPASIVSRAGMLDADPAMPGLHRFVAIPSAASHHSRHAAPHLYVGVAPTPQAAAMKALGELVERDAALALDPLAQRSATPAELALDRDGWTRWNLYGDLQYAEPAFPFVPLTATRTLRWVSATEPAADAPCWVPAARVALRGEAIADRLNPPSSNGLAAHGCREQCLLRAVLEAIERDAIMTAWLTREGWTPLALDEVLIDALAPQMHAEREYRFFSVASLAGHTVACLSFGRRRGQPAVIGSAACAPSLWHAVEHNLAEQAQAIWSIEALGDRWLATPPHAVRRRLDHLQFWATVGDAAKQLKWLFELPNQAISLAQARRIEPSCVSLDALLQWARWAGVRLAVVDLATERHRRMGFHIVRVVAPHLTPLYFGPALAPRGVQRVAAYPSVNPLPHPFL